MKVAEPDHIGWLVRLAAAWASTGADQDRPWIAFAMSDVAHEGVLQYFTYSPGENEEHDESSRWGLALLPLDQCSLTVIELTDEDQRTLVELTTHPPAYGSLLTVCATRFRDHGFSCNEPVLDDSCLYSPVDYATGETGFEQVLGWDDLYSDEQWRFLGASGTVFIRLRSDLSQLGPDRLTVLASIVRATRREFATYGREGHDAEYEDSVDEEAEGKSPPGCGSAGRRCPSSSENVGRVIEIPGMDEWKIECPTCGAMWAGGSTVLIEHERVR
ncbi:hypothetical protein [Actinopolymorpha alba]|uniref:hypothetical protein n=1 Tax=Actinopolymorpha alba TaxID=533267 RepID=UPI001ED9B420|nr:hypothetical protein [Actinopolymorpha alba]